MQFNELNKLVINLPERKDRLESFPAEMCPFQLIEGVKHVDPKIGIAEAHRKAILTAVVYNLDHALIMEDDLRLRPGSITYLKECLNNLPDEWDLLTGGIYDVRDRVKYNDHWDRIGQFCGLHFYIANKSIYQRFLDYDGVQHIDRFINYDNQFKCFTTSKMFALQSDGHSDNVGKYVNYDSRLKKMKLL